MGGPDEILTLAQMVTTRGQSDQPKVRVSSALVEGEEEVYRDHRHTCEASGILAMTCDVSLHQLQCVRNRYDL